MLPSHIKSLIIDMDGVIWRADTPIGDLAAIFDRIRERGLTFVFATNNSTKTSEQYVERLKQFGVDVKPWQMITSSQGVAHAVAQKFPPRTKVFMIVKMASAWHWKKWDSRSCLSKMPRSRRQL